MTIQLQFQPTLAFLFFVTAAVLFYFSQTEQALAPWVRASFCFFSALGPLDWLGRSARASVTDGDSGASLTSLMSWLSPEKIQTFCFVVWVGQLALVIIGIGFVFFSLPL